MATEAAQLNGFSHATCTDVAAVIHRLGGGLTVAETRAHLAQLHLAVADSEVVPVSRARRG